MVDGGTEVVGIVVVVLVVVVTTSVFVVVVVTAPVDVTEVSGGDDPASQAVTLRAASIASAALSITGRLCRAHIRDPAGRSHHSRLVARPD
jgi:hypothetical protein